MSDKLEIIGKRERNLGRELLVVTWATLLATLVLLGWGV